MEGGGAAATVSTDKQAEAASYTYWVREMTQDAAPVPVPRKLTPEDLSKQSNQTSTHLGSAWNRELLESIGSLDFSRGKAEISEVTRCTGDAFVVTVRNKRRVGYTYELTLKVKGEWVIGSEKKTVKGHIDIAEFSLGELDDLEMQVRLSEDKDFVLEDKQLIIQDIKRFMQPLQEKLQQFEQELKDR